ncbi:hypothetical protein [Siccirubricoccus sp. G192]|uniref:hypothetical protein n=1 Tax=Siccirubricoccus sp. G192 TaxID=2849651 RepID=UPI001C2CB3D2|nr:hypothetical protein [Siccirubricoccus sp. G192]MBV1800291.1 hypothetical protein [Siccirubricoccus sp. G192]
MPAEGLTGNKHLLFQMSGDQNVESAPIATVRQITPPQTAKSISPEVWSESFLLACKEEWPAEHELTFCEIQHQYSLKKLANMHNIDVFHVGEAERQNT